MALLADPQVWITFATLTTPELVLGIDNIIFISILVDKLPASQREYARRIGLIAALFMRVGLLLVLSWIIELNASLLTIFGEEISGRDLVLTSPTRASESGRLVLRNAD
jgi:predicted tellurium resistance membrane protein TerC